MTDEEWKARFKARFESLMGLKCGPEFLESARSLDTADDDPEAAGEGE